MHTHLDRIRATVLRAVATVAVCSVLSAGLCGCTMFGYSVGSPELAHVQTVHVPIFEMDGFRRDLDMMLTEAVQREIKTRTRYRIASAATADTILSGRIIEVRKDVLGETAEDDPRQLQLGLGIEVIWIDRRTGDVLNRRTVALGPEFRQQIAHADFAPEVGQSLATASTEAVTRLADQIVDITDTRW